MAQIEPFRAIRFNREELSGVIAPPYDILTAEDKEHLLAEDEHNIVAIDLPHVPPKSAGPDAVYQKAAGELTSWLDIHCLVHDRRPAFYAYHQTYQIGGRELTRKKFFARLRLEPFGEGSIYAHEQTFGGPKEDRLKLTQATRCNLSPIFGLYPDAENGVAALIDDALDRPPDQSGVLDGVQNKLWAITDPETVDEIRKALADKPIFIADGHHRYGTALMYRDQQLESLGTLRPADPINFVLAVLGGMEDPGATIQPYFRTICDLPELTLGQLQDALSDVFNWTPISTPKDAAALATALGKVGEKAMALYIAKDDACAAIKPKDADLLAPYKPERDPALRNSPYFILHRYVLDEVIAPKFNSGTPPTVHYHKSMANAMRDAVDTRGLAALMPATAMTELRNICMSGELMPQKSTYFYPKLATGMVINPLYE